MRGRLPRLARAITCAPQSAHSLRTPAIRERGISATDQVGDVSDIAEVKSWNMGVRAVPFDICVV